MILQNHLQISFFYQVSCILKEQIFDQFIRYLNNYFAMILKIYYYKFFGGKHIYKINIGKMLYLGQQFNVRVDKNIEFTRYNGRNTLQDWLEQYFVNIGIKIQSKTNNILLHSFME
jgi:hypothetical protein